MKRTDHNTKRNNVKAPAREKPLGTAPAKLAQLSLLTAAALIMYVIELQLPSPAPIPGVKLGLANIFTVVAVYYFSAGETGIMLAVRVILGAIFAGNLSSLLFSASGAALCLCGMLVLRKILPLKYIWLCSIFGAMLHNIGQIGMAVLIMRSAGVLAYLPFLLAAGCIAGLFTGLCAQFVVKRLHQIHFKNLNRKGGNNL